MYVYAYVGSGSITRQGRSGLSEGLCFGQQSKEVVCRKPRSQVVLVMIELQSFKEKGPARDIHMYACIYIHMHVYIYIYIQHIYIYI